MVRHLANMTGEARFSNIEMSVNVTVESVVEEDSFVVVVALVDVVELWLIVGSVAHSGVLTSMVSK